MIAYERDGAAIYRRSFATIRAEADLDGLDPVLERAVVRMIHACGMVDLTQDIAASPRLGTAAEEALRGGAPILCEPSALHAAPGWFPLVGGLIGAAAAGTWALVEPPLGSSYATALALTVSGIASGGLHHDGLADTADGLGARGSGEAVAHGAVAALAVRGRGRAHLRTCARPLVRTPAARARRPRTHGRPRRFVQRGTRRDRRRLGVRVHDRAGRLRPWRRSCGARWSRSGDGRRGRRGQALHLRAHRRHARSLGVDGGADGVLGAGGLLGGLSGSKPPAARACFGDDGPDRLRRHRGSFVDALASWEKQITRSPPHESVGIPWGWGTLPSRRDSFGHDPVRARPTAERSPGRCYMSRQSDQEEALELTAA